MATLSDDSGTQQATIRLPGEGDSVSLMGEHYTIKVRGADTNGAFGVVEAVLPPGIQGPPAHINTREVENIYVVDGTLTFVLNGDTVQAPAGSYVSIPPGVVHTWFNQEDTPVKAFGFVTPAGFETFFQDQADLLASMPPGSPDPHKMQDLLDKYGLVVVQE